MNLDPHLQYAKGCDDCPSGATPEISPIPPLSPALVSDDADDANPPSKHLDRCLSLPHLATFVIVVLQPAC